MLRLFREILSYESAPDDCPPEWLLEGPAGTGKTLGVCQFVNYTCERWPGTRWLWMRQERSTMPQSVMETFEKEVLRPDHPALLYPIDRNSRTRYQYENGSEIVLAGLDRASKTFSTQFHGLVFFEAIETEKDAWEKLLRANRHFSGPGMPMRVAIADTNPGPFHHWLNKRAIAGLMQRLCSRHKDNPALWDEERGCWTKAGLVYLEKKLGHMTGANRARLLEGKWVSEDGLVIPQFDPIRHVITAGHPLEHLLDPERHEWYFASMDFGFNSPGCLHIWAVTDDDRMVSVAEVYRRGWTIERWAEVVEVLFAEFRFVALIADSAEPGSIKVLNDHLSPLMGRSVQKIARPTNKRAGKKGRPFHGLEQMRYAFQNDKVLFAANRMRHFPDPYLESKGLTLSTTEELVGYHFRHNKNAETSWDERPDSSCPDHGCDAARYGITWRWRRDYSRRIDPAPLPGTYAWAEKNDPALNGQEEARLRRAHRWN